MEKNDNNDYISSVIKKRKEIYFLVTEKDLNTFRTSSLLGDLSMIVASIILNGYFLDKNPYVLFAGVIFILIALRLSFVVITQIKELKSSGEVESIDNNAKHLNTIFVKQENNKHGIKKIYNKNKLNILVAIYGVENKKIYITKEIKELVRDDKLSIIASNIIAGDPYPGKKKKLQILYEYEGVEISKVYKEGDKIEIP